MRENIWKQVISLGMAAALMLPMLPTAVSASEIGDKPMVSDENSLDAKQTAKGSTPSVTQGGIQIDGNFDDWENVPKTVITWDNQNNEKRVDHIGALYREDNKLYVLFQEDASYKYYDTPKKVLQLQNMEIDIGVPVWPKALKVLPVNNKGNIIGDPGAPMKDLPNGVHTKFAVFVYEKNGGLVKVGSQVAYRVQKEANGHRLNGDAVEFVVELDTLARYWKADVDDIKTIKVQNHWLGKEMVLAGSSSYALTFLLIAVPIVLAGYAAYRKKKKTQCPAE